MNALTELTVQDRSIVWRLEERMRAAKFATVLDLHEKLKTIDEDCVAYPSLARMISQPPARLNLRTLVSLTIALDCSITDILDVGPANTAERS